MKAKVIIKMAVLMMFLVVFLSCSYSVKALTLSEMEDKANDFIDKGAETSIDYEKVTDEFVL